jgi:hypothetical protein
MVSRLVEQRLHILIVPYLFFGSQGSYGLIQLKTLKHDTVWKAFLINHGI